MSRIDLTQVYNKLNLELQKQGFQTGIEILNEIVTFLFLKVQDEQDYCEIWSILEEDTEDDKQKLLNDYIDNYNKEHINDEVLYRCNITSSETITNLVKILNEINLSDIDSDILGDAFEYLLKTHSKDSGSFFTPKYIVDVVKKLANIQPDEKVYDPFCGSGGLLLGCRTKLCNPDDFFGADITSISRIAKVNMVLNGGKSTNITKQNSFANPAGGKYDCVVANMPFNSGNFKGLEKHYPFIQNKSANGDILSISHCFEAIDELSDNPRIILIVPEGILFNKKFKAIRKYMYENSFFEQIISLPQGVFMPFTNVKTNILYMTKVYNSGTKSVNYFDVKNDGYTRDAHKRKLEGENDIDKYLAGQLSPKSVSIDILKDNDYVSIPRLLPMDDEDEFEYSIVQLGDLIEVENVKNEDFQYKYYSLGENELLKSDVKFENHLLKPDLYKVLSPQCFVFDPKTIHRGQITMNIFDKPILVNSYTTFRVTNAEKIIPKFLYYYVQTSKFKDWVNSQLYGSNTPNCGINVLKLHRLELPPLTKQQEIISRLDDEKIVLDSCKTIIKNWKPHIESEQIYDLSKEYIKNYEVVV